MKQIRFGAVLAGLIAVGVTMAGAQASGMAAQKSMSLGSVQIAHSVTADGKPLAAGTYMLRVSDEMPTAVVGQSPDETRWVEFVQGSTVKGREIATVLSKDALKAMGKGSVAPGTAKVQTLKGNDYVRVWINHSGTQYLIHLAAK
jgi:hypothetical protein